MSLRIVSGRSGSGKTTFIHQEIITALQKAPIGDPIFGRVNPGYNYGYYTFYNQDSGLPGLIRAQVTTFKRLAWRVLQETGGIAKEEISGFGY